MPESRGKVFWAGGRRMGKAGLQRHLSLETAEKGLVGVSEH